MAAFLIPALLLATVLLYAWVIWRRLLGWESLETPILKPEPENLPFLSVLVAVRNEARNLPELLADLGNLRYPRHLFEVWIIDDHSQDQTEAIVNQFQTTSPYTLNLLSLKKWPGKSGKKAAIEAGVAAAKGEFVVCTDGDCRVPAGWLEAFGEVFATGKAQFLSGPVVFDPTPSLFEKVQLVEFAALVGVGAGSIALGKPTMCNGANIGYAKSGFEAVRGFAGNEQVASGDDEFLMYRIHRRFPGQVRFLKNREALVTTRAQPTLRRFFRQRVRWASKWRHYEQRGAQGLALLVFGVNLMLVVGLWLVLANALSPFVFTLALGIKVAMDSVFLYHILAFLRKPGLLLYVVPLQVVYVPYVLLTAIFSLAGRYEWKGRSITPQPAS